MKRLFLIKILGLHRCNVWRSPGLARLFRPYHAKWGMTRHKIDGPWRAVEEFLSSEVKITDSYLQMDFKDPTKLTNMSSLFKSLTWRLIAMF